MANRIRVFKVVIGWLAIGMIGFGNVEMLSWVINTWSGGFTFWGWIKAIAIEVSIIWAAHTLTDRIMYNQFGRRLKSYPLAPIKSLYFSLAFLTIVSGVANSIYYGLKNPGPTSFDIFNTLISVMLGISAPIMTIIITYTTGQEAGVMAGVAEAEALNKARLNRRRTKAPKPVKPPKVTRSIGVGVNGVLEAIMNQDGQGIDFETLKTETGLKKSTLYGYLKELSDNEKIVRENGRIHVRIG
jgi:hypothetical protein